MKQYKRFLVILALLLLLVSIYYRTQNTRTTQENVGAPTVSASPTPFVTENADGSTTIGLHISSPEKDTIIRGQARLYRATFSNQQQYVGKMVRCNWDFSMKGDSGYVPYKNQENRGIVKQEDPHICTFTSTLLERLGTAKVTLSLTIYDATGDIETLTTEREYTVVTQ